jgi:CheY-like chemotaxis protein
MTEKQTKPSVLLVDDDTDFLFQQQVQLEAAGFEVITAPNENHARKLLAERRPDLAVLDVMMDQPDAGFTLCYHIRKTDPTIPIILVTSITRETGLEFDLSGASDRAWIRADAILAKPIRFEQLKREIDRLMGSSAPTSAHDH